MTNVGLVGLGYIGRVHLDALSRLPGVTVAAIATRGGSLEGIDPSVRMVEDYQDLLDDPSIAVIHNCTPNNIHAEVTLAALAAGKHVLSEKPLGLDAAESVNLARVAAERGLLHGVNYCYRYYPAIMEAKARVADGSVGRVHSFVGHYLQDWLLYDTDFSWRLEPTVGGRSNALADIGSHVIDLVHFILGDPIAEVFAEIGAVHPVRMRPLAETATFAARTENDGAIPTTIETEDHGFLLFRTRGGTRGSIAINQAAAGRGCDIGVQVYGTQTGVTWRHDDSTALWVGHRGRPNERVVEDASSMAPSAGRYATLPTGHPLGYRDAVLALIRDFHAGVVAASEGTPVTPDWPTFDDGARTSLVIEAALASADSGRWQGVQQSVQL